MLLFLQIGSTIISALAVAMSIAIIVALLRGEDKKYRRQYRARLQEKWKVEE